MNTDDATMRRSIARKSFLQRENKTFNFYSSGLRSWSAETHYSVLGVDYEATQEQIRTAYIRLSKEFHPDYNAGVDDAKMETIHNKFVKINAAYSVLGNKKQRRMYDLEVLMHEDPRWKGGDEIKTDSPHHFNTRPMSFEERAAAMGFRKQDPNFYAKHGNYHRNVVVWCMVFIAVGVLVQGTAILALYKRHSTQMDLNSANNTTLLIAARANSRNFTTVQEQLNSLNIAQPIQNQDRRDTEDLDIKSA
ncbi:dnaJ homolog subfamily C member 4 [Eurytemora carolleeae]|uniref:dnaJ homolog subfamily C member 4 n=1 Tax=Eurytemora carolleeae TaxID=1294199 RepID=UPI000C794346|nr:dnaJ homolog subfamily C member 4 [Eurytemora carolleeae]|eukprot:XP_023341221.1 dnaJ homolog subfamily C member 4-like [Eurytemora affinis]